MVGNGKPNYFAQKAGIRALTLPPKPARKRHRASAPLRETPRILMEMPDLNSAQRAKCHKKQKSKSLSLSLSESKRMALGHERLDVYRLAIAYVVGKALDEAESQERKDELDRMVSTSATSEPVRRRRMGVRSAAVSLLPT